VTATLTATALAVLALTAPHAAAQSSPAATTAAAINIPAQPLPQALTEFGRQSGLQLVYAPDLVQGKRSTALVYRKDAPSALAELLQGTGLQARQVGGTCVGAGVDPPLFAGEVAVLR
jgi:outer membrane receptor for ferric coprogen and ferric-rhodotorulic acid